ncbi:MAG TPA: hypothetical protein GX513_09120 [Firmicutes bacterium]|nr:hypothetical protein [Bacillota bacterium]
MKVIVLGGAGAMGSGIVRDLISAESAASPLRTVEKVIMADASLEAVQKLVAELLDRRLEALHLDVRNKDQTVSLLEKADVCINAVPTFLGYQMDIFHYCLEARCPYLDLGGMGVYTEIQKAEHDSWVRAGVPAVLGMGSDPGLSNVLAKAVAERLDTIDRIDLFWASRVAGPERPIFVPPYNILTLLAEYSNPSRQFIDGTLVEMPAQSGKLEMTLPEPFGRMEFMHSQHSEPITVPFARGFRDKGIKEFTWRLHLSEGDDEVLRSLVKCGFGDFNENVTVDGMEVNPGRFLEAIIRRNIEKNKARIGETSEHQIHLAVGEGERDGRRVKASMAAIMAPDPYYRPYADPGTSMCASIGAQMMGSGKVPPGVWGPEECIDTGEFFAELKKRRFRVIEYLETVL